MLSKSLGAARTAVRDLFRSADHRRNREHCWHDAPDEWGVNTARARAATPTERRGNESGTTTKEDVPTPPKYNVIIKEGPRRHVPHVRSGPAVEGTYLVLDRVPASSGKGVEHGKAGDSQHSMQMNCSRESQPGSALDGDGEGAVCDGGEKQESDAASASAAASAAAAEDQRMRASTLFAYRAMKIRERRDDAARLCQNVAA
ncbi:hypothetical protein E4U43_007754 [Claviceps pusilla]|uniref:Uncharacterized protein n=1 Tax=Claviceps pusilla TaxID=123648 RepID=A0A9P7SXV6_9HYPO|nr:hypothetical protein E4U43_007754 [Claviceps pusilla]